MHALRTAIIEHTTATSVHHDWLIEDPTLPNPKAPAARLWTARVNPPPANWPNLKRLELTVIPPHRRHYLTYQGDVPGNRGRVKRLASGTCFASLWSEQRIVLMLQLQTQTISFEMQRLGKDRWLAIIKQAKRTVV